MKKIVKDALVLFAITLVAGILLGVVYQILSLIHISEPTRPY